MSQGLKAEVSLGNGTLAAGNIHKTACLNKIKLVYLLLQILATGFDLNLQNTFQTEFTGGQTALQSHAVITLLYDSAEIC